MLLYGWNYPSSALYHTCHGTNISIPPYVFILSNFSVRPSVLCSLGINLFFNKQILIMLYLTTDFFVFFPKSSSEISNILESARKSTSWLIFFQNQHTCWEISASGNTALYSWIKRTTIVWWDWPTMVVLLNDYVLGQVWFCYFSVVFSGNQCYRRIRRQILHETAQLAKKGSTTVSKGKRMLLLLTQW